MAKRRAGGQAGRWAATCALLLAIFAAQPPALAQEPAAAPDFALKALGGGNHRLSEHRGEVVALLFWGSWCGGCRSELERLERLGATYGGVGFAAFGIVLDENPGEARSVASALGLKLPQLHDAQRQVARAYRPRRLPTLLLVDRGGSIRHAYGELDSRAERAMLADLRSLLDE